MELTADTKMVIVLDESLPNGLKANTAAVLALTLGGRIKGLLGPDLKDASGEMHTGLTTLPLPILKATPQRLQELYEQVHSVPEDLLIVDVTDAAQTTTNYQDYEEKLSKRPPQQLKFLGLALAGPEKRVRRLTGNLALLR